jgi:hypothetical protein
MFNLKNISYIAVFPKVLSCLICALCLTESDSLPTGQPAIRVAGASELLKQTI